MSWKKITSVLAFSALLAAPVMAQPTIEILDGGLNGGNRIFEVYVTPDPTRYSVDSSDPVNGTNLDSSSIAVELGLGGLNPFGFAIPGVVSGTSVVTADFQDDNVAPLGNPGYDPFQGGIAATGIVEETSGTDLFAALGSTGDISIPSTGLLTGRTLVLSFEVDSEISVINLSGWDAGTSSVVGARVAQDGELFTVTGTFGIAGDYQPNGAVDIVDFGLFGAAFGNPASSFLDSDFNRSGGNIDIVDFGVFGGNFGLSMPTSASLTAATVPEPSSLVLIGLLGLVGLAARQVRK